MLVFLSDTWVKVTFEESEAYYFFPLEWGTLVDSEVFHSKQQIFITNLLLWTKDTPASKRRKEVLLEYYEREARKRRQLDHLSLPISSQYQKKKKTSIIKWK